jgi:hypothetical protein
MLTAAMIALRQWCGATAALAVLAVIPLTIPLKAPLARCGVG